MESLDGLRYWSSSDYPAGRVNLRTISDDTYTIVDHARGNAVLGTVDAISAPELIYPEAIYLHEGDTWFVRDLDLQQKVAAVERREVDYYTQPVLDTRLRLVESRETKRWGECEFGLGSANVSWATVAFKKIRFKSLDAIGYHPLDLPRLSLDTVALWIRPEEAVRAAVRLQGFHPAEAMSGLRNLLITLLPLHAMCDRPRLRRARLRDRRRAAPRHAPARRGLPLRDRVSFVRRPSRPSSRPAAGLRPPWRMAHPQQGRDPGAPRAAALGLSAARGGSTC